MTQPMTLDDLTETFDLLDDWEDRYAFIIDLGRRLEPMPEADMVEANKVRGCMSQVWLTAEAQPGPGTPRLHFRADSDAMIVKGLIAILMILFNDRTPAEIAALDAETELQRLGLDQHISPNRRNGVTAMIERIKAEAARAAAG
jgi:cysteine desulfuration protein SufE